MNSPPDIAQYYEERNRTQQFIEEDDLPKRGFRDIPLLIYDEEASMMKRSAQMLYKAVSTGLAVLLYARTAFAEVTSEEDLRFFLEGVGDFLILTVGPGVLVVGVAVAGVSMALGDDRGMQRGAIAAGGGALIMLSRAVLDLIQNVTGF